MNLHSEDFVQRDKEKEITVLTGNEIIAAAPLKGADDEFGVPWAIYKTVFGKGKYVDILHIERYHEFPKKDAWF